MFFLFKSLISSSPSSEFQWPCVEIEKLLFSLVILKTVFVHSREVFPKRHLPSSTKLIGGLNEKVAFVFSFYIQESILVLFLSVRSMYQYAF